VSLNLVFLQIDTINRSRNKWEHKGGK